MEYNLQSENEIPEQDLEVFNDIEEKALGNIQKIKEDIENKKNGGASTK